MLALEDMIQVSTLPKSRPQLTTGVSQNRKETIKLDSQIIPSKPLRIRDLANITSNKSQLAWKWSKVWTNKKQFWKRKLRDSKTIKNWFRNCPPRLKQNMLTRRRGTFWGKSTWPAKSNQVHTRICTKWVILNLTKSKTSCSSLEQPMLRLMIQISLILSTQISDLAHMRFTPTVDHLKLKPKEEPILQASSQTVRISFSVVMLIQAQINIQPRTSTNLSNRKTGRPILVHLEQLRESLLRSIQLKLRRKVCLVQDPTPPKLSFRKSMQPKKLEAKALKLKIRCLPVHLFQLRQGLLILIWRKTSNSTGQLQDNMKKSDNSVHSPCKVEPQTTSYFWKITRVLHHSPQPCPDSKILFPRRWKMILAPVNMTPNRIMTYHSMAETIRSFFIPDNIETKTSPRIQEASPILRSSTKTSGSLHRHPSLVWELTILTPVPSIRPNKDLTTGSIEFIKILL